MSRIVLLTGGSTPERTVALAGAGQVVRALRSRGHVVTVVDTCFGVLDAQHEQEILAAAVGSAPPGLAELDRLRAREDLPTLFRQAAFGSAELVFLVLHGRQGEGGEVQTLLDLAGHRYTGSDAVSSGVAMDKELSKRLIHSVGVDVPRGVLHTARRPFDPAAVGSLGSRLIVKPSRVGSTVGLTLIEAPANLGRDLPQDLDRAIGLALRYDQEVLIEEFVDGRELTVGVLEDTNGETRALEVGEIVIDRAIFDFETKYTPGMAAEIFPAEVTPGQRESLQEAAVRVHRALKLRDYSRVDFRLGESGRLVCLEANTLPGMTRTSLLPQSARAAGLEFDELCQRFVELALER